ncbi:MAG: putative two-component system response regulator [Myxococcota bacterium]|jgi:putative two-component system response regulator
MSSQKLTVLLVDDDPILQRKMRFWAEQAGFCAEVASDGVEALARIRKSPPDLVVTDVHMPRMQGPRLVELLRQLPTMATAPVMVVTADASRETKVRLLQNGADDFILKPIDGDEFTARLRAHARRCDISFELVIARRERDDALEEVKQRADELERLMFGLVTALEQANTLNDEDTGNHIRRVAEFAALLATDISCPLDFIDAVRRYAGLHDVGKVGIPDSILKKPGKLTVDEFDEMKAHTLIGADLLRAAGLPEIAINVPLCHHERWDGSGYPRGIVGDAIPLEARIVAVVDVYDALRSRRCYKPPFTLEKTFAILRESAGSHLDPHLVVRFLELGEQLAEIEARFSDERDIVPAEKVWA